MHVVPPCLHARVVREEWKRVATRQYGLLSRTQAFSAGLTRRMVDARVLSGRWTALERGIYLAIPFPPSWHQRLMTAVLQGGHSALASHRAAARLWGLDGLEPNVPVEISLTAGRDLNGVIVHRRRSGDRPPSVVIDGIPTTAVERTLLDLAGVVRSPRVA